MAHCGHGSNWNLKLSYVWYAISNKTPFFNTSENSYYFISCKGSQEDARRWLGCLGIRWVPNQGHKEPLVVSRALLAKLKGYKTMKRTFLCIVGSLCSPSPCHMSNFRAQVALHVSYFISHLGFPPQLNSPWWPSMAQPQTRKRQRQRAKDHCLEKATLKKRKLVAPARHARWNQNRQTDEFPPPDQVLSKDPRASGVLSYPFNFPPEFWNLTNNEHFLFIHLYPWWLWAVLYIIEPFCSATQNGF